MKQVKLNEKGYALFIALAVVIIFSVLGLSMLTITSNGLKKNEIRQNTVQATDLADKGLDLTVKDIQKYLETQIKATPMGKTEFETFLVNTLSKTSMQCPANGSAPTGTNGITLPGYSNSETKICIAAVDTVQNNAGIVEEKDKYKRIVTFKSFGLVNGKQAISTYKVVLGTDAIPDQLRYAVSANDNGDLYFHGGVEVKGDIKSAGNIYINKYAHWLNNGNTVWVESVPLKILADSKSVAPKIILPDLNKRIYYYQKNSGAYNSYSISNSTPNTTINPNNVNAQNTLRSTLFNSLNATLITKEIPPDNVDIPNKINDIFYNTKYNFITSSITDANSNKTKDSVILVANKTTTATKTNVCIRYKKKTCVQYEYKYEDILDNGTFNINKNATIQGQYFVKGNVTIDGGYGNSIQVKNNAILYVDGDVTITNAALNGLNDTSTLIVFATGNISISNISVYQSTPSTIKGFFYTKQDMIMYGVGSNINLYGGISARNLRLTAVRGASSNNSYESVTSQTTKESRLKIIYDENLISQYTSFKRDEEEEFITELNEPEILDRQ